MTAQMKVIFGIAVILLFVFAAVQADLLFWLAPPAKKFALVAHSDFKLLDKYRYLPPSWGSIRNIDVNSDASHVQEWLKSDAFEIPKKKDGNYNLEIFVSEWIDGYRYGALIQYDLIDIKTKNTVWELNRTYKLGFMY